MTDFVHDAYTKRCWDQLREIAELKKSAFITEEFDTPVKDHPLMQKFHACLFRPIVSTNVRNEFTNCLKQNNGDITKCQNQFFQLKNEGLKNVYSLLMNDNYGTIRSQLAIDNCKQFVRKARDLKCWVFPEQPDCVELKEQAFHCITNVSCRELQNLSTMCFMEQSALQKPNVITSITRSQTLGTRERLTDYCNEIQGNLLRCFDKYFLTSMIFEPDKTLGIRYENADTAPQSIRPEDVDDPAVRERFFYKNKKF